MTEVQVFKYNRQIEELYAWNIPMLTDDQMDVLQEKIGRLYKELEGLEPEDPESEEFIQWEEMLEKLDDLYDDIFESED